MVPGEPHTKGRDWMAGHWEQAVSTLLGAVVLFIFGWVVNALQTRKKFEEFEVKVVNPLREQITSLKAQASTFVTREELQHAVTALRADLKEWIAEIRDDLRAIRDKH